MKDTIYREDALFCLTADITNISLEDYIAMIDKRISELPSAEPEPIFDKIRSEIEEVYINLTYEENRSRRASWGLRRALEIIDKYKSKSDIEELPSVQPERKKGK